jgi:8-oxo-dGTP diphosphatase
MCAWHRVTVGVILRNAEGAILLQLRDDIPTIADPGCWAVPGGAQDPGESYEAAARREMLEETGYTVGDLELVCERDLDRGNGVVEHQVFFLSEYDGVQALECYEGQKIEFMSVADARALELTPDLSSVLERVLARRSRARDVS